MRKILGQEPEDCQGTLHSESLLPEHTVGFRLKRGFKMSELKKKGTGSQEKASTELLRVSGIALLGSLKQVGGEEKKYVASRPLLITRRFLCVTLGNLYFHLLVA